MTLGAFAGSRYLGKIRSTWLRALFVDVLLWVAFEMLRKGWRAWRWWPWACC